VIAASDRRYVGAVSPNSKHTPAIALRQFSQNSPLC
jgi:hypothetical protein